MSQADRQQLLAAVCERHNDPVAKHLFAGWLEDHGTGQADADLAFALRWCATRCRCHYYLPPEVYDLMMPTRDPQPFPTAEHALRALSRVLRRLRDLLHAEAIP